jgi:hypothetical protein
MPPDDPDEHSRPAGRVKHDPSGRAVWEWAAETGRSALDSTSRLLKRLELPGLTLADDKPKSSKDANPSAAETPSSAKPLPPTFGGARESDPLAQGKQSFNPYDNRAPANRAAQPKSKAPVKSGTRPPSHAAPIVSKKKPGLFARLFGGKS